MKRALGCVVVGVMVALAAAPSGANGVDARAYRWVPSVLPSPVVLSSEGGIRPFRIACPVVGTCAAAGVTIETAGDFPFLETLTAGQWSESPAPLPPDASTGAGDFGLRGISCAPQLPLTCVAVGAYLVETSPYGVGYYKPLLEELSGGTWTASSPPVPAGPAVPGHDLVDVSCGATTCVAVGATAYSDGFFVYTRSGGVWSLTTPTGTGGLYPTGISCPSDGSCVVVGYASGSSAGFAATLAGGSWTTVALPGTPEMTDASSGAPGSVSCPVVGFCVAAGSYVQTQNPETSTPPVGLIDTLSGGRWKAITAPVPWGVDTSSPVYLNGVSCPSSDTCVVVGDAGEDGTHPTVPIIEVLGGGIWRQVAPARPANRATPEATLLFGVACASVDSCTASGTFDTPKYSYPLIEQGFPAIVTRLAMSPAVASLPGPTVQALHLTATLTTTSGRGVAGKPVAFFAHGSTLCTSTTDASGTATCDALTNPVPIIEQGGYSASFKGDTDYLASGGSAPLITTR